MATPVCALSSSSGRSKGTYARREPEKTVLHQLVREHLESFLEEGRRRSVHGEGYPAYVEQTFRRYLTCGIMAHGCAKLRCAACGHELFVAFSCKGRGVCPSCQARRMSEIAATLVDTLLPAVPFRQWVFTYPVPLRLAMARDPKLLTAVMQRSLRTLAASQRRRARALGYRKVQTAALSALQRFGSAINLNPHAHVLTPDGVFTVEDDGTLRFVALPPPSDDEVEKVARGVMHRVRRLLSRMEDDAAVGADEDDCALSTSLVEALAPRSQGRAPPSPSHRCAQVEGFGVHADVAAGPERRDVLERLIRYALRPPLAQSRLTRLPSGRIRYKLRKPWHDGSTHIEFEPLTLMRRLALLIPPPRQHTLRYHGLFAANAKHRKKLTALLPKEPHAEPVTKVALVANHDEAEAATPSPRRWTWAQLLRRVFKVDVEHCPKCESPLKLIAMITEVAALTRLCTHLGLPTSTPQLEPARLPPQMGWDFGDDLEGTAAVIAKPAARGPPAVQWLCLPHTR